MKALLAVVACLSIPLSDVSAAECTLSPSVRLPFLSDKVSLRDRRISGEAIEHLFTSCPKGPSNRSSRALFFDVVDLAFTTGERAGQSAANGDQSEAAWEGASQFEYDLQQYMDRIVDERDVPFKAVILKTANAHAISRLGPDAKYDVLRLVHIADRNTVGAGHHSPYKQALLTLGDWIDPTEERFSADEKREMTEVLLAKAAEANDMVDADQAMYVGATLKALGHASSPEALDAIRRWSRSRYPSLREVSRDSIVAVKARLQQMTQ